MTYVIAEACVDCVNRSCVKECPVDCIYEGARTLYIHPVECIDCGACVPACPVEAIYHEDDLPESQCWHRKDNEEFFSQILPGRSEPLNSPDGAAQVGRIGGDTPRITSFPRHEE